VREKVAVLPRLWRLSTTIQIMMDTLIRFHFINREDSSGN
jgi:hypothetical protein